MTDQDPTQAYQPPAPPAGDAVAPPPPSAPPPPAPQAAAPTAPAVADTPPVPPAPAAVDGAVAAAAVAPARKSGRSPVKWVIAALVVLLLVGVGVGATLFLTSSAGSPTVAAWTPADSVAYTELRLDLPGSQSAELAKLMKAFPGFEDQAAFPVKLSEALDLILTGATDGKQSYKTDIEPWFGGQIAASLGPIPASAADAAKTRGLILLSVKDSAKAETWAAKLVADTGATTTSETYGGVKLTTVSPSGAMGDLAGLQAAYAIVGPTLALGDVASVKASIDTGGKTGLATVAQFQEAEASLPGDRLAFGYVDTKAVVEGAKTLAGSTGATGGMQLPATLEGSLAPWAAASIRADSGALVIDTRAPHMAASGAPKNTESKLPGLVPATTVALVEGHNVGETIARTKDLLAADPELKDSVKQIDDALQLIGGLDAVSGWIDELGVVVTRDGDKVRGGIVATPTDAAAAERLFNQVAGFVQLGGASAGIKASTEDYKGTTITIIDLSAAAPLLGSAAGGVELPKDLTVAFAVTKDVAVIGYGADFVKSVIDAKDGESLADTDRFSAALKRAGDKQASLAWVDITGMRGLVESMIPADGRSGYDASFKPYLAGFDSLLGTSTPGDKLDAGTVIISVVGG